MRNRALALVLIAALAQTLPATTAFAQDWNPFDPFGTEKKRPEPERRPPPEQERGPDTIVPQPGEAKSQAVERLDLSPVMATDGSGLPYELWRGLDVTTFERLIAEIEIPPRSPALHALWLRLITSNVTPPGGGETDQQFMALRLETLYRSGLLEQASQELAKMPASSGVVATLAARNDIGLGKKEQGCATAQNAGTLPADLPKPLKAQAAMISGYCAAVAGDVAAAGLAAEMAREEGVKNSAGLEALDAISVHASPKTAGKETVSLLDYRLVEAGGGTIEPGALLKQGAPSLLAALALDANTPPALKLPAAEAAAQVNAISPDKLADIYRKHASLAAAAAGANTAERRAQLFVAAEAERTPLKKVRLIRSFLDESRRAGLYLSALAMSARASDSVQPVPEIGWYAETAIEIALAAGDYDKARSWANFGATLGAAPEGSLSHWLALIDIADSRAPSNRGESLHYIEDLAVHGRLDPTLLHRVATVLDALAYDVPIPLWEAASRTPQPAGGFLPETGVLSELQDAAKKREFGRTVLLAMKTLGPNGAEGAHMIALGDSIRALKRAGLEPDARRLGFEALFASWPRAIVN
jgi:hypothetical protein